MSELPPPARAPEPLAFNPQRDRVSRQPSARSDETSSSFPSTRDFQRELIGQTVGGRYRIKGILGEGGMGTVYDGEHIGLSRQVAIKVLSPSQAKKRVAVKRFQQEARAAGAIGHPNICEVYDLGLLDDGSPYLVMEKLVGQTLAERISKEGGLPFDEVVEVISQVLSGLVAAHDKGIVHRDIKPENIFLARRLGCPPIVKLLDFGVSKMMAEFQTGDDVLDLTRTGMVMGTPYYMSPEQARGERNLDGRVDVYACGVVMYEALAGRRPFLAPNYNALLLAIISTTPRPIRDVRPATPPELEAIMRRAMAKNRSDRYASAKQMLRELMPSPHHLADSGHARIPAPPTMEERKRAQVLGGGRGRSEPPAPAGRGGEPRTERGSRASRARGDGFGRKEAAREPARPDLASATLQSRMRSARDDEHATRLDVKVKLAPSPFDSLGREPDPPLPPLGLGAPSDDSIDIPIHVSVSMEDDGEPISLDDIPLDEEDPTEVFHPGKHRRFAPPSRSGRGAHAPPQNVHPAPARSPTDDWDSETVVGTGLAPQPPAMVPHHPPPHAANAHRGRPPVHGRDVPFNPEETMKLEGGDLEVLENRRTPPRRR